MAFRSQKSLYSCVNWINRPLIDPTSDCFCASIRPVTACGSAKPTEPRDAAAKIAIGPNNVFPLSSGQAGAARRPVASPIVRIHLLGHACVYHPGIPTSCHSDARRAPFSAVSVLRRRAGIPLRLAAMLWDRVPEFQARASFRQAYRRIAVAFGPLAKDLLSADRDTVSLNASACWIDALAVLSPAAGAHRNDLLALARRIAGGSRRYERRLRSLAARASARALSNAAARCSKPSSSRRKAGTPTRASGKRSRAGLSMFDPTHEGASRILMRALADRASGAQALREFARCRDALKRTLDAEPSPETCALYEAIRSFAVREEKISRRPRPRRHRASARKRRSPLPNRNRLRVGVLPFLAIRSPRDEGWRFSMSQEIAAALARFRWFDVIAPVALKRRDGARRSTMIVLRPNDLDFVLDGSLTSSAREVPDQRPAARPYPVCDAGLERPLRAARGRAAPARRAGHRARSSRASIRSSSISRASRRAATRHDATGCVLRAIPLLHSMDRPITRKPDG